MKYIKYKSHGQTKYGKVLETFHSREKLECIRVKTEGEIVLFFSKESLTKVSEEEYLTGIILQS